MSESHHESRPPPSNKTDKPQIKSPEQIASPRTEGENAPPPSAPDAGVSSTNIQALQAIIGNQAVQRLISEKPPAQRTRLNGLPPVRGIPTLAITPHLQRNEDEEDSERGVRITINYNGENIKEAYLKAAIIFLGNQGIPASDAAKILEIENYPSGGEYVTKNPPKKKGDKTKIDISPNNAKFLRKIADRYWEQRRLFEASQRGEGSDGATQGPDMDGTDPDGTENGVPSGKQGGKPGGRGTSQTGGLEGKAGGGTDPKGSSKGSKDGSSKGTDEGVQEGEDEGSDLGSEGGLISAPLWVHKIIELVNTISDFAGVVGLIKGIFRRLGRKAIEKIREMFEKVPKLRRRRRDYDDLNSGDGPEIPDVKGKPPKGKKPDEPDPNDTRDRDRDQDERDRDETNDRDRDRDERDRDERDANETNNENQDWETFEVPKPVGKLSKPSAKWLKDHGVDPHELKDQLGGSISQYDIYKDRVGNLFALPKRGGGEPIYLDTIKD